MHGLTTADKRRYWGKLVISSKKIHVSCQRAGVAVLPGNHPPKIALKLHCSDTHTIYLRDNDDKNFVAQNYLHRTRPARLPHGEC